MKVTAKEAIDYSSISNINRLINIIIIIIIIHLYSAISHSSIALNMKC